LLTHKKPTKMSACPNCGTHLSCGCQKKKASNGTFVCKSCINKYEQSIKSEAQPGTVFSDLRNNVGRYKNLQKFIKT
jgi:transcription elongation factor Elf1